MPEREYAVVVPRSTRARAEFLARYLRNLGFRNVEIRRLADRHDAVMTLGHVLREEEENDRA